VVVNLSDHIQEHHGGSQSEAARYYKVSRQVMAHWLKRGAIVIDGKVYLPSDAIVIDNKAFTPVGSSK